jgi:hypothetical protein
MGEVITVVTVDCQNGVPYRVIRVRITLEFECSGNSA